jgi:hypothetical protein
MKSRCRSKSKSYDSLRKFFTRQQIENPGALTMLFYEKFVEAQRPTVYQKITADDLKSKNLIPSKTCVDFSSWRREMIVRGILICMATQKELTDAIPNFKAGEFRFGPSIKKYIEAALVEKSSIFERIDSKATREELEVLAAKQMTDRLELAATKEKVADLELKVEDLSDAIETLLLHAMPPDTPIRRAIVRAHRFEKEVCIDLLKKNLETKN